MSTVSFGHVKITKNSTRFIISSFRCPITFGLSSTLRRIKNGMSRILVLSADLKPRYVINQIILLALARNETVHIFCVPNLEHEMRSLVDFACFAFAIGDVEMSPWKQVFAWCKTMTIERYPVPELIRAYFDAHRRRTSSKNETIPMETESVVAIADVPLSHVHLVRPSAAPERRAFIPTNAINLKPMSFGVTSLGKIKSDFISLDTFDSDDNSSRPIDSMQSPLVAATPMRPNGNKSVESTSYSERYQSAKIKRYSGNPAKRKNDGSAKLPRDQKKELRLARKAMRKAKKNK